MCFEKLLFTDNLAACGLFVGKCIGTSEFGFYNIKKWYKCSAQYFAMIFFGKPRIYIALTTNLLQFTKDN